MQEVHDAPSHDPNDERPELKSHEEGCDGCSMSLQQRSILRNQAPMIDWIPERQQSKPDPRKPGQARDHRLGDDI